MCLSGGGGPHSVGQLTPYALRWAWEQCRTFLCNGCTIHLSCTHLPLHACPAEPHPPVRPPLFPRCGPPSPHPPLPHPAPWTFSAVVYLPPPCTGKRGAAASAGAPAPPPMGLRPLSSRCLPTLYPKIVLRLLTHHLPLQASAVQLHPPVRPRPLHRCCACPWSLPLLAMPPHPDPKPVLC